MEKQKTRTRVEQIQAEIEGLSHEKDALFMLGNGIRSVGHGIVEIGDAIQDMLMIGTENQLTDAQERLEIHKPNVDKLTQELMQTTEGVQQAEAYLVRMQEAIVQIPEEYRGFLQMLVPAMDMQIQMRRERVQAIREELERIAPMPDASLAEQEPEAGGES